VNKLKRFYQHLKGLKTFRNEISVQESLSANVFQISILKRLKGEENQNDFSTYKSFRTYEEDVYFTKSFSSKLTLLSNFLTLLHGVLILYL
jgi:hypothetical protein